MPIPKKVINYLDKQDARYDIVEHRTVYTAYDAAATLGVELSQIAKTLMVKAGKNFVMIALPANRNVNFEKLAKVLGVSKVTFPKEKVLHEKLKIKPGLMAGFSGLYKVALYIDTSLTKEKKVIISSGSPSESIQMTAKAYMDLEESEYASFTVIKKVKLPKKQGKSKKTKAKKQVKK